MDLENSTIWGKSLEAQANFGTFELGLGTVLRRKVETSVDEGL